MPLSLQFDLKKLAQALEFPFWWQWLAIAIWGWAFTWLLEGCPRFGGFVTAIPRHPVMIGIASFATVWYVVTFWNAVYLRCRRRQRRASAKPL